MVGNVLQIDLAGAGHQVPGPCVVLASCELPLQRRALDVQSI